jgi:hypothetical protein
MIGKVVDASTLDRQIRRLIVGVLCMLSVLVVPALAAHNATESSPASSPHTTTGTATDRSPIGTNLPKLTQSEMLWTINQAPLAENWLTQCDESCNYIWNTHEQDQLVFDANGWILSFGDTPNRQFTHVALAYFNGVAEHLSGGEWAVLYEGEATVQYDFSPFIIEVSRSPGREVLRFDPSQATLLRIRISNINPANHLRNLRLIPPGGICGDDPFRYAENATGCPAGNFRPFEQVYMTYHFHPLMLQALRPYRTLRFMQWQGIVDDVSPSTWDERSQLTDAIWGSGWGDQSPPLELMFELSSLLQADLWVNLFYWADDTYVRNFAELAHELLDPTLTLYLEYSNEVWNGAYPYSLYGNQIEAWAEARWPDAVDEHGNLVSGYTKRMNWVGMRSAQICALWKAVWGTDAERIRCVMPGGPWEFPASEALACPLYAAENGGNNCAGQMYAVASAPYFGGYINDNRNTDGGYHEQLLAWTQEPDGGLNSLFHELRTGELLLADDFADAGAIAAAADVIRQNKAVADRFGLKLISYEGGQHLTPLSSLGTSCNDWNNSSDCPPFRAVQNLLIAANRDPRMGELYTEYLNEWRRLGGSLFVHYTAVSLPSGQFGSWGAKESILQPDSQAYKQQALFRFIEENPCWWPGCEHIPAPTSTATPVPTSTAGIPADSLQVFAISPDEGNNGTSTNIVVTGNGFQETPLFQLGIFALTDVRRINSQQLAAVVPSGLARGTYDLTVTLPAGTAVVSERAFTVTGNGVALHHVQPAQGLAGFETTRHLYGANFAEGARVQIAATTLPAVQISDTYLRVTVPDTLPVGAQSVTIVNPGGDTATALEAFTVLDRETADDLYATPSQLWTAPGSPRAAGTHKVYLTVTRLAGQNPLSGVNVQFWAGSSDAEPRGEKIGSSSIALLAPNTSMNTLPVDWTPATPGTYTLYAAIDPDNLIQEPKGNNVVSRTLTVLPPTADLSPPYIDRFALDAGAESTPNQRIRLALNASDPSPGSGLHTVLYQEFEFSQAANQWVPGYRFGWLDYDTSHTGDSWDLLPSPGIKYLHAWVADRSGNIANFPYQATINYVPPTDRIGRHLARSDRYAVKAGAAIAVTVVPIHGDPDLYIWLPNSNVSPYVSNLADAAVDALTFTAESNGEYQIEVYGYSAAEYQLTIEVNSNSARSGTQNSDTTSPAKELLEAPVLSRDSAPFEQQALPTVPLPAEIPMANLYLPVVID